MNKRILMVLVVSLAFVLLPGLNYGKSNQLKNFDQVLGALKTGNTVKVVFFYKLCKLIADNEVVKNVPDAIGGMELKTWEYFAKGSVRNKKGFISASKVVLIKHPSYGFVNNYVKVRIYDDNSIRIIAMYLTPGTNEVEMNESFYTEIDNGNNKSGARFYIK